MFPVYRINSVPSSEHGYHSPLEGESQKPSRMAKADAEGGRRGALRVNVRVTSGAA